jgi:hypothetical protein
MMMKDDKKCFECGGTIAPNHKKVFLTGKVAHARCVRIAEKRLEKILKDGVKEQAAKKDQEKKQENLRQFVRLADLDKFQEENK